jgi:hypothetical protein
VAEGQAVLLAAGGGTGHRAPREDPEVLVLFNERAIESFFAENPDKLPKRVKKYYP